MLRRAAILLLALAAPLSAHADWFGPGLIEKSRGGDFFSAPSSGGGGGGSPPSIDGSSVSSGQSTGFSNPATVTITTAQASEVVACDIVSVTGSGFSSIGFSDSNSHIWHRQSQWQVPSGTFAGVTFPGNVTQERWWAYHAAAVTGEVITPSWDASAGVAVLCRGVIGANSSVPFDPTTGASGANASATASGYTVSGINSTTNVLLLYSVSNTSTGTACATGTPTVGGGFTTLGTAGTVGGGPTYYACLFGQYETSSGALSSASATVGSSAWPDWIAAVDVMKR